MNAESAVGGRQPAGARSRSLFKSIPAFVVRMPAGLWPRRPASGGAEASSVPGGSVATGHRTLLRNLREPRDLSGRTELRPIRSAPESSMMPSENPLPDVACGAKPL